MATPLNPQEIYLLERYSSADYFGDMRDAWAAAVKHAETALAILESNLPADHRRRTLPSRLGIISAERLLRSLRATRDHLDVGFIEMTHANAQALGYAGNVLCDYTGFSRDYATDWMDEPQVAAVVPGAADEFWRLLGGASLRASNIRATLYAQWNPGSLSTRYDSHRGPLLPPASWPKYLLNPNVTVATGLPVPRTGIYLPDADDSTAAFMIEGKKASKATIGFDPVTTQNVSDAPTTWTLVERSPIQAAERQAPPILSLARAITVETPFERLHLSLDAPIGDFTCGSGWMFHQFLSKPLTKFCRIAELAPAIAVQRHLIVCADFPIVNGVIDKRSIDPFDTRSTEVRMAVGDTEPALKK